MKAKPAINQRRDKAARTWRAIVNAFDESKHPRGSRGRFVTAEQVVSRGHPVSGPTAVRMMERQAAAASGAVNDLVYGNFIPHDDPHGALPQDGVTEEMIDDLITSSYDLEASQDLEDMQNSAGNLMMVLLRFNHAYQGESEQILSGLDKALRTVQLANDLAQLTTNSFDPSQRRDDSGRWVDDTPIQFSGHKQREAEHDLRRHEEEGSRVTGAQRLQGEARELSEAARWESEKLWRESRDEVLSTAHHRHLDNSVARLTLQYMDQAREWANSTAYRGGEASLNHRIAGQFHEDTSKFINRLATEVKGKARKTLLKMRDEYTALAAMHRDAAQLLEEDPYRPTGNAFDPSQPRAPDGRWRAARGEYDPTRGGVQDSELLERLQASEAAADVTGVLVYDWSNSLLPEMHESLYHDTLTEAAHNKLLQTFSRIAEPLHRAGAMAYGARKATEKFQRTGDQTFADEASLDHGRIRNALLRAHKEVADLEQTPQVKALARRIQEAVALNHDASEMLVGNAAGDNCGTGAGGFKKGNRCSKGAGLSDAVRGSIGATDEAVLATRNLEVGVVPGKGWSSWSGKAVNKYLVTIRNETRHLKGSKDLSYTKTTHQRLSNLHETLAGLLHREYGPPWVGKLQPPHINEDLKNYVLSQTAEAVSLHRTAAAIHHDAAEEIAVNSSQDNCGTGDGGFKPGNTCGHKYKVTHEVPGHHGAAWQGQRSGHVARRASAQPVRVVGEDSQWRTQDEEYEASQGARHVTEDATEAVHQFLDNWKTPRRMEEERNTLHQLAMVAANYANKAALYSRQGRNAYVKPGHWQHDYKTSGSYHQLASQSHIRLVNELRRNFLSSTAPGVRKSDVQRIIDRNLLAAHMHRDAGLMLTGNAGNYEESKHKRDNAGKFSSTGGGGGSPAPRAQPAAPQAPAAEEPYQPRQRLQDAQGGAAYTEIREALQADVLTRPLAGVLGAVSSKFQTGVDKQYNEEVKETFKGIFSRLTLGTGPLAVKAVAAGVRQSPRLFRLLVQGMQEAGKAGAAGSKRLTGNAFDPSQARDSSGRWSRSWGQTLYGAAEKAGVMAGLGAVTWSGVHSLVAGGANAGIAGVGAFAGSGAVASPVAMGASMWLPTAGSVGLSTAGMATVAGATGVGLLAMPLIVGLATKGRAGGMLNEDAYNEMTDVFQGIFSRMTLGTGPLAVRATAAGIRHSPKLFRLLVRGLNEAATGATAVGRGLGHAAVGAGQGLAAGYRAATHNTEGDNCGTGAGGFKRGNTCGKSGRFGDSRDTSDHWQEDHQGVQRAEQEVHREIGPLLRKLELDLYHNQDYLGMENFDSAAQALQWLIEEYYTSRGHVNSARHRANTYHKTGLSSDRAMVRTWYRKASDGFKTSADYLSLLRFKDKSKIASLLKEMQNLTHDAAETLTGNSFDPNQPRDDLGRWSLSPYQHSGHTQRQHEVNRPHSTLRPTQTMLEEEQEAANEAWKVDDLATTATARVINPIWDSRGIRFIRGLTDEALNMITHDNERASNHSWMAKDMALKEDLDSVPAGRDDNFTYRTSVVAYLDAASTRRERIAEALERFFMHRPGAQEAVRLNREAAALLRDAAEMTQR